MGQNHKIISSVYMDVGIKLQLHGFPAATCRRHQSPFNFASFNLLETPTPKFLEAPTCKELQSPFKSMVCTFIVDESISSMVWTLYNNILCNYLASHCTLISTHYNIIWSLFYTFSSTKLQYDLVFVLHFLYPSSFTCPIIVTPTWCLIQQVTLLSIHTHTYNIHSHTHICCSSVFKFVITQHTHLLPILHSLVGIFTPSILFLNLLDHIFKFSFCSNLNRSKF